MRDRARNARVCEGASAGRERAWGSGPGAGEREPIHAGIPAGARAGGPSSALSPAGAARAWPGGGGAAAALPITSAPGSAPGRSRPPAPSCQTVTLSVTVRSNDIRALKQLVIRGVISCN